MDDFRRLHLRRELLAEGFARPDRASTEFIRVRRGVYGDRSDAQLTAVQRHVRLVQAADETLTGPRLYSHESAAALLDIPILGRWPEVVHLLCERRSGGRSQLDVVRHCLGLEHADPVVVGGLAITSPARTAFDMAVSRPFEQAVVVADAVLHAWPEAIHEFSALVEAHRGRRGYARALAVLGFADGRSESVGESVSRVRIERAGFVRPQLQFRVVTDGLEEFADFGWPEAGVLGEFDGEIKYRFDRYRRGGSVEDVVIREKNRENRMRRAVPEMARWDWRDLHSGLMVGILIAAGVPRRSERGRSASSRGSSAVAR